MVRIDVVIPALDAAAGLGATLDALLAAEAVAVTAVVVDGGSTDGTRAVAEQRGAAVLDSPRGRGVQMAAGACHGTADWLLFFHADTRPPEGWDRSVAAFCVDPANARRAGVFAMGFDDSAPAARRVEAIANWRSRRLGLPYGDQGLLIARAFHDEIGGFRPIPIMEDVDIVRRVGRARLVTLPGRVATSAARYRRMGYAPRMARNLVCLTLYFLGLPPRAIARLYG